MNTQIEVNCDKKYSLFLSTFASYFYLSFGHS